MSRGKRYDNEPKLNMKKVFGVIIAFIVIIMVVVSISKLLSDEEDAGKMATTAYFSALDNNKWGVINSNGEIVIEAIYDEMVIVPNKTKAVFLYTYDINDENGTYKTKVLNEKGEEIFTNYELVEAMDNFDKNKNIWYEDNVLKVKKDGKYGLIDFKGNELLKCEYDDIYTLKGITNSLILKNGENLGLANNVGQIIIPVEYKEILQINDDYRNGYIVKNNENKYGVYNINGIFAINVVNDEIKYINSKECFLIKKDGKYAIEHIKSNIIIDNIQGDVISIDSKLEYITLKRDNKYGVINTSGETKIPFEYDELNFISDNKYIAKKDNKYGIIDIDNQIKLNFDYIRIVYRKDANIIEAQKTEIESIVYNQNLEEVFVGIISEVDEEKGYIKAFVNNEYKYYNFKLEQKNSSDILTANNLFLSKKDGKYGYVDKSGNIVIDYIYDDATEQNKYGYCAVKQNGVWGSLDRIGKIILNPSVNLDNSIFVEFIGQWHLADNGVYYTK